MKKLLVLALVLGLCSSACGKKEEAPATDDKTAEAKADDTKAADAKADSPKLLKDDGTLDKDAADALYKDKEKSDKVKVDMQLLKDESPLVRAYAYNRLTRNYDQNNQELQDLVAALKTEKDPAVLKAGLKSLMNNYKVSSDLYELAKQSASHENKDVRMGAAMGLVNSNNKDVEGLYDEAVKLLDDEDAEVASYACENILKLEHEGAIDEVVKRINSEEAKHIAISGACALGLQKIWYNYPSFDKYDAAANKATIDYLKKTPRTKDLPSWNVVSKFMKAPKEEWKSLAKDFDAKELVTVLSDIVKDENANTLARQYSIEAIAVHGTKADLEALSKDLKDDAMKDKVAKALEKM